MGVELGIATQARHKIDIARSLVSDFPVKLVSILSREPCYSADSFVAAKAKLLSSSGDRRVSIDTMKRLGVNGPSFGKVNGNTRDVMDWFTHGGIIVTDTTTLALINGRYYKRKDEIVFRLKSGNAFDPTSHWSSTVSGGIKAEDLYRSGDLDVISATFRDEKSLIHGFIGVSGEAMRKAAEMALGS